MGTPRLGVAQSFGSRNFSTYPLPSHKVFEAFQPLIRNEEIHIDGHSEVPSQPDRDATGQRKIDSQFVQKTGDMTQGSMNFRFTHKEVVDLPQNMR